MIAKTIATVNLIIGGLFVILGLLPFGTKYPKSAIAGDSYWSFIVTFSHIFQYILLLVGIVFLLLGVYLTKLKNRMNDIDTGTNFNPKNNKHKRNLL